MSARTPDDAYLLGRTEAEERRLQRQAALLEPATRRLFAAAGIGAGMRVLDLGSGAGDVAMLAAAMVGPAGRVVGVDANAAVLETARRRARAAGHANVAFVPGDLRELELADAFDAVVGRYVLCYLPDPAAALRRVLPRVRPGGVAAFHEFDGTAPATSWPPAPLFQQVIEWTTRAFVHAGVDLGIGLRLPRIFVDAGLEAPQLLVSASVGSERADVERWATHQAESVRSLLPLLVERGIATEAEVGVETLAARCVDELVRRGSVIRSVLAVGAWARTR
jgi:SAM-dependent methyltransferase